MVRPRDTTRRARATLLVALVTATLAAWTTAASGQEAPAGDPSTTTTPSTPSTTAPPATVVLADGDFGVIPPGAEDPTAPPADTSPPPPAGGDVPLPPELPPVVLPDPTPGLNAALAAIDVTQARRALVAADEGLRRSRDAVRVAFARRADAVTARRAASQALLHAKAVADALAVNAVMYGDVTGLEPIIGAPTLDQLRDRTLGELVATTIYDDLHEAEVAYRRSVANELAETVELTNATATARVVRTHYLDLRTALDAAIRHASEARRQVGPTILGEAVLDAVDLVTWYRTYYPIDPPVAPIEQIVETYLRVGAEEGVTADIAFAQAILETGGFRSGHARDYNFAGIGAYDHCAPGCGFRFANLDDGVRAHLQLLRAYADPGLTSAQLAARPNALVAPENVDVRGCCPRWTSLTGAWASDPNYDRKVLGIYRLMVETARAIDRLQA